MRKKSKDKKQKSKVVSAPKMGSQRDIDLVSALIVNSYERVELNSTQTSALWNILGHYVV